MDSVERIVLAIMLDAVNTRRLGEDAARLVALYGVVFPAAFPQLVDDLHVFFGDIVAVVMGVLAGLAHALGGAVEIAGDDVPADAAIGEVIEGRHPAGEWIGRLVR